MAVHTLPGTTSNGCAQGPAHLTTMGKDMVQEHVHIHKGEKKNIIAWTLQRNGILSQIKQSKHFSLFSGLIYYNSVSSGDHKECEILSVFVCLKVFQSIKQRDYHGKANKEPPNIWSCSFPVIYFPWITHAALNTFPLLYIALWPGPGLYIYRGRFRPLYGFVAKQTEGVALPLGDTSNRQPILVLGISLGSL